MAEILVSEPDYILQRSQGNPKLYKAIVERTTADFIIGFTLLSSFMKIIDTTTGGVASV
jgi:hypothetical protein